MEEQHLSLSEAADRLDISERTARRWIKSGKLRAYKPGRDYWIPESAIKEVVLESEVRPKAPSRSAREPSLFNGLEDERRQHRIELFREMRQHVETVGSRFKRDAARLEHSDALEDWNALEREASFACIGALAILRDEMDALDGLETEQAAWRHAYQAAEDLNTLCDKIETKAAELREGAGRQEDAGIRVLDAYRRRAG